jgi:salicylate hydroxylase
VSAVELRVAVVGGGIGGLTLAIALRRLGVEVEVFEQAPEMGEIGAAVALSANGTRHLRTLGVDEALTTAAEPSELQFRRWDDAELIWAHRVGEWYRERCGAPYYGIHRADLQSALVDSLDSGVVHLGHQAVDVVEETDGARLMFEGGETAFAHVVVAADGIHSVLREKVAGEEPPAVFSGGVGYRGLIPVEQLPTLPDPMALQFWAGPGGHLLHYAVDGGKLVNFLAVVDQPEWTETSWKVGAEVQEAVDAFDGWHPAVTEMVGAVGEDEDPAWWALHDYEPLERWTAGRLVLMGDSAHAMLPHQGQGANQAIEDAVALAHLLAEHDDFRQAFRRYEALRMRRTRRVQWYSRFAGKAVHVPDGPEAERRNAGLSTTAEDIAWIHEYDVEEDLAAAGVRSVRTQSVDNQ